MVRFVTLLHHRVQVCSQASFQIVTILLFAAGLVEGCQLAGDAASATGGQSIPLGLDGQPA